MLGMPTEETRVGGPSTSPTEGTNRERGRKGRGRRLQQPRTEFRAIDASRVRCLPFHTFFRRKMIYCKFPF